MGRGEAAKLKETKHRIDIFVVGGLHADDFAQAATMYIAFDYLLIGFLLDADGYHWKAIYVKAEQLEKILGGNTKRVLDRK